MEAQKPKRGPTAGYKVPVKYRGPNGEEWSGRGKTPNFIKLALANGKTLEEMLVLKPKE